MALGYDDSIEDERSESCTAFPLLLIVPASLLYICSVVLQLICRTVQESKKRDNKGTERSRRTAVLVLARDFIGYSSKSTYHEQGWQQLQ
jgi:hypothetical protein